MQNRDPLVQTLLSFFVPFYVIYWSHVTAKEIERTYNQKAPNILLLLAPIVIIGLAIITLFSGGIFASGDTGDFAAGLGFFFLLLLLFPVSIILSLIYYYQFGGNVEKISGPSVSRLLTVVLFWLFSPAGVYIIQDKLNTLGQTPQNFQPQSPVGPQQQINGPPPPPSPPQSPIIQR